MRSWLPHYISPSYIRVKRTGIVRSSPPLVLAIGFCGLILAGTALLTLPVATRTPLDLMSALFMATSAVTITGLSVTDIGANLTYFGQATLLVLVQLGGLGYATFAVVSAIALGNV